MAVFQQSTLSFLEAKTQIAEQASKQNTSEFLRRAGKSLQHAFKHWNRRNWKWLMVQAPDVTASVGATSIGLPYNFKDLYTVRVESPGRQHALKGAPRRLIDRMISDQTLVDEVRGYDLFNQWANPAAPVLTISPPADSETIVRLKYYRRMTVPCSVTGFAGNFSVTGRTSVIPQQPTFAGATVGSPFYATTTAQSAIWPASNFLSAVVPDIVTPGQVNWSYIWSQPTILTANNVSAQIGGDNVYLDLPEDFENGLLSWAVHHFLSGLGAPEGRLRYFISLANGEEDRALEANETFEDEDHAFQFGDPGLVWPHSTGYA